MTLAPFVELRFNPTDLRPQDLPTAGAFLGSPAEALEAALAITRTAVVNQIRDELRGVAEPTHAQLLRMADLAWQLTFWRYRKVSAPIIADAYIRAYRRADAGDVPMSMIYDLADKHAEKIGMYFHESSREALAEGFNGMVNRQVPAKVAADRVLDAYGLTSRQMRGYSGTKFQTPINDVMPRALKAKARAYIDRSFTSRIKKLSEQEEHNIDQQAQQFAWMWLQDKGRLSEKAQKLWITAKDERVCKVCGPLHGKKVGVNERFKTAQGDFWTPGLHPNCRCVVRLLEMRFTKSISKGIFAKAGYDPRLHPRGGDPENKGRFSRRNATLRERDSKPVIETSTIWETLPEPVQETVEPETEKVSLGGVSLGGVSLGGGVSLAGGVALGGGKASLNEGKASLRGGKASLRGSSLAEIERKIDLAVAPEMRVAMEETVERAALADVSVSNKAKPKSLFYRPTMQIKDPNGNPYPVYAVVGMTEPIDYSNHQVELNPDITFSPDIKAVWKQYDHKFREQMRDVHMELDNYLASDPPTFQEAGTTWTMEMDEEELASVIAWKAYRGHVPANKYGWQRDDDINLEWSDERGNRRVITQSKSSVAEMLHLSDDDFAVRILRMDEGHLDTTAQAEAGTKYGTERWVTSGLYRMEPTSEEVGYKDGTQLVEIWHLDPDVKEIEIPSIFKRVAQGRTMDT